MTEDEFVTIDRICLPNPIKEIGTILFKNPICIRDIYCNKGKVYFTWDFGMDSEVELTDININDFEELKAKLIEDCVFHLGHAFFHTQHDPNYTAYHWALFLAYKNNVDQLLWD
jgi:hypothetical protein